MPPRCRPLGPYMVRDGTMYCARCGRLPLTFDPSIATAYCRHCDEGELPELEVIPVAMVGGELMCARCRRNEIRPTGPQGMLECPGCDLPPWERQAKLEPKYAQLTLEDGTVMSTFDDIRQLPERPSRPANVVRRCRECRQSTDHYYAWKFHRWRALCPACGHMLQTSRDRSPARAKTRKVTP